ncbi:unnamed protein product [Cladocopium goreaui]|uniref:N-acetyltransferase domain-containing protein n=1 Tax=Cladocopium goreaui TaxID=2562237 RepID=A0A9P1GDS7_9DINO|nr:unnamed protein product [Cladocopium goreaui]
MAKKVQKSMFFTVRDENMRTAKCTIQRSSAAILGTRYKPSDQTILFFAAARRVGQDAQALALCRLLVDRKINIDINHGDALRQTALFYAARQGHADTIRFLISLGANPNVKDSNGETAMFFAVRKKRTAAVKALLDNGAHLKVVNKWHHTCFSLSPAEVLPVLQEERQKKRSYDESGPGPKRRRTAAEELRAWADEWPIKEPVVGKEIDFREEDVLAVKSVDKSTGKHGEYAVLSKCPGKCAARLRLSEKEFVYDHAMMMKDELFFEDLKPEDWCQNVGVLTDAGGAVEGIKGVVTGKTGSHFTLPLVQKETQTIAGYVHATYCAEEHGLRIAHLKVDEAHIGQGLGVLLLDAAEQHSHSIGWKCKQTFLSVLKANARARKCYAKAGFRVASSTAAAGWGAKKQHAWSEWQKLRKRQLGHAAPTRSTRKSVHKYALKTPAA